MGFFAKLSLSLADTAAICCTYFTNLIIFGNNVEGFRAFCYVTGEVNKLLFLAAGCGAYRGYHGQHCRIFQMALAWQNGL